MWDFDELKEKLDSFIHENPFLAGISGLILFFFLAAMVIVFIQSGKPKPQAQAKQETLQKLSPMPPEPPEIEKDYYQSRKTENLWSDEELNQWYSEPDSDLLKELQAANDKIIEEITGAAP